MKSLGALVFAACLCAALGATAQNADSSGGAITWNESNVARKQIALQRVVTRIPQGEPVGKIFSTPLCLGQSYPITVNWSGDLPINDFQPLFARELAEAGYPTSGSGNSSDSLFDHVEDSQPNLFVAGAITSLNIRLCREPQLMVLSDQFTGTADIVVDWQVMDPLERKIVFRGTTQGHASIKENIKAATMVGMRAAFTQAARTLLAIPEFQQVTTKIESATAEQVASAPPPTSIPAVPLSTTPFTQNVKSIEARVATVDLGVGHGSGFYIADGLLLTNHHVASKGMVVKLRFPGGREAVGNVVAANSRRDVALVSTAPTGVDGLPLRLPDPDIGSQVYVLGSPLDIKLDNTLSAGIVSAMREIRNQRYIQSDVTIQPGNSGGPMFDDKGNVIGISVMGRVEGGVSAGINFFIPIAEALTALGVTQQAAIASSAPAKKTKKK